MSRGFNLGRVLFLLRRAFDPACQPLQTVCASLFIISQTPTTFVPHHYVRLLFRRRKLLDNIMEWRKGGGKIARTVIRGWKVLTLPLFFFGGRITVTSLLPRNEEEQCGNFGLIICLFFRTNRI